MKRTHLFGLAAIVMLTLVCVVGCRKKPAPPAPPQEQAAQPAAPAAEPAQPSVEPTVKLSYSIFFPPTHIQCKTAEAWAEEIEKRTNGRVEITLYPGRHADQGPAGAMRAWSTAYPISA